MFYNGYDDYMRGDSVNSNFDPYSGYDDMYDRQYYNTYTNDYMNYGAWGNAPSMNAGYMPNEQFQRRNNSANLEQMYPEIYKVINPMVRTMCDNNNQPITERLVEQMTNDIYDNVVNRVEIQNVINVNIGTRKSDNMEGNATAKSSSSNRGSSDSSISSKSNSTQLSSSSKEAQESSVETRACSNCTGGNGLLKDLIRILIINRLIRPNRPPVRPGNRPPFRPNCGNGGNCGNRPPFRPDQPWRFDMPILEDFDIDRGTY